MLEKIYHTILGVFLVLIGIYLVGYCFDLFKFNIFFKGWWTLIILIPAVSKLLFQNDKVNSLFWIIVGVVLLLYSNHVIKFAIAWKLILASLILILGFNLIFYVIKGPRIIKSRLRKVPLYFGMFGEAEEKVNTSFSGCTCASIVGGVDLDLTDAKLEKDIYIEVLAVLGTTEIVVPKGTNVIMSGFNILGNSENKLPKEQTKGRKKIVTVHIRNLSILGGVEVR